jgi:hypothetical protein
MQHDWARLQFEYPGTGWVECALIYAILDL